MHVRWVEVVFNVSGTEGMEVDGGEGDGVCRVSCRVDGVRRVGWPEYASGGGVAAVNAVVNEDRARVTVSLGLLGVLAVALSVMWSCVCGHFACFCVAGG